MNSTDNGQMNNDEWMKTAWHTPQGTYNQVRSNESEIKFPLEQIWEFPISGNGAYNGLCAGANGRLFIPDADHDMVCIDLKSGQLNWEATGVRKKNAGDVAGWYCCGVWGPWVLTIAPSTKDYPDGYLVGTHQKTGKSTPLVFIKSDGTEKYRTDIRQSFFYYDGRIETGVGYNMSTLERLPIPERHFAPYTLIEGHENLPRQYYTLRWLHDGIAYLTISKDCKETQLGYNVDKKEVLCVK